MLDPQVAMLGQYQWISVESYPSAVYIVNAPLAEFGGPYQLHMPTIRGVQQVAYSAPDFTFKANQALPVKQIQPNALGTLNGAAPTSGVYTGIPSGCGPGGIMKGNPYS